MLVKKAIIPAAGLGTRLYPLSQNLPKEMLPLGSKPMVQWAVEMLLKSGLKELCIIISPAKKIIKDFLLNPQGYQSAQEFVKGCPSFPEKF